MVALRRGRSDFECARDMMTQFESSPDTAISQASGHAAWVFGDLATADSMMSVVLGQIMDGSTSAAPKHGQTAETIAELSDLKEKLMVELFTATLHVRTALFVPRSDKSGIELGLSGQERSEAVALIRQTFGASVLGGPTVKMDHVQGCAASLCMALSTPAANASPRARTRTRRPGQQQR